MIFQRRFALLLLLSCVLAGPATAAPSEADLLIEHAEQAMDLGNDREAEATISRIRSGSLDVIALARLQIIRAQIGLARHNPQAALRSLPPTSEHVPSLAARIELLRARAQFLSGDAPTAVRTLVARERNLPSPSDLAANRDEIWNGLIATPMPSGFAAGYRGDDPVTRGWLELAGVMQRGATPDAVTDWLRSHPGHPASDKATLLRSARSEPLPGGAAPPPQAMAPNAPTTITILPGYGAQTPTVPAPAVSALPTFTPGPVHEGVIALLLPLSGPLAVGGRALREGFVSAWFDAPAPRPALRVYDSGGTAAQAVAAFDRAASDGASIVVGPLTKDGVAAIARGFHWVDWLALNYLDGRGPPQFGLAPEDEARAAAHDAIAGGRRNALALVPLNDWGSRALEAFTEAYRDQGGRVLQTARYAPDTQDFGAPLQELLKLDQSRQRNRELDAVLGQNTEFEPRPRADADVLFAPLRANEARVLVPQLAFFRAGGLDTYMLSAAHGGQIGPQLDGMHLCDMPWVLDERGAWAQTREHDAQTFADILREQPRLFAMGRDAYTLAQAVRQKALDGSRAIAGASGQLSLGSGGRIDRTLECRMVRNGHAVRG